MECMLVFPDVALFSLMRNLKDFLLLFWLILSSFSVSTLMFVMLVCRE